MRIVYWMILLFISPCFAAQNIKVLHIVSVANNPHSTHAERILRKSYRNIGYSGVFHPLPSKRALSHSKNTTGRHISSWADLRADRIGIKRGVLFAEKAAKGMNVCKVDTSRDLFRMLDAGRVDFVIENEFIAQLTLNENSQFASIKKVGGSIYSAPLFHYLYASQEHVVSLLDREFRRLSEKSLF